MSNKSKPTTKIGRLLAALNGGAEVKVSAIRNKTKLGKPDLAVYLNILEKRGAEIKRISEVRAEGRKYGRGRPKTVALQMVKAPEALAA